MAVFQSVGQALHVAFLMEVLPARQKCFAQVVLEDAQREAGLLEVRERSTIDFEGLNDLEVRGQCAMVRKAVELHLPIECVHVVHAMYAHQVRKADAVRAVYKLCAPALITQHEMAILAMLWGIYGTNKQRKDFSVRKIADGFGLPKSTIHDDVVRIRSFVSQLEAIAMSLLGEVFYKNGVCE